MTTRTWRAKRRIGAAALVALIGSTLAFAFPAAAPPLVPEEAESVRISGADRYATAADAWLNDDGWAAACIDVVVVNGDNFPDGLAASIYYSPILLVKADSIPAATAAAITAQETACAGFGDITVVGGTSVVSSAVLEDLDNLIAGNAVRVAGDDRYSTAAAVAADWLDGWDVVACDMILATGENFPDALAAGPLAVYANAPILLNTGDSLLPVVKTTIAGALGDDGDCDLGVPTVHIVGGPAAVPASVDAELQSMGINVNRIAGANRAETAAAIASTMNVLGYGADHVVLVNGNGFADALAAGPMAIYDVGVIMPVNADSIPAVVAAWHVANCADLDDTPEIRAVGGTAVISDAVLTGAAAAATCTVPTYTATLANLGNTQAVYTANGAGPGAAGVTFTAVAGSAAAGVAGNDGAITLGDSGTDPSGITVDASGPSVDVVIEDFATDGVSQADLVALWNADPGASALFTAAPDGSTGSPTAYTGGAITMDVTETGTTTQQVVFTFSEDVDDCGGTVSTAGDFDVDGAAIDIDTSPVQSPLPATPGGASVYTFTMTHDASDELHAVGEATQVSVCVTATGNGWADPGQVLTAG